MPETELITNSDFPLPIPQVEGSPVEWSPEAIAQLVMLKPDEMMKHLVQLLAWYVKEDDVIVDMPGNEYWAAGYHMAKALLAAQKLRTS